MVLTGPTGEIGGPTTESPLRHANGFEQPECGGPKDKKKILFEPSVSGQQNHNKPVTFKGDWSERFSPRKGWCVERRERKWLK